MASIPRSDLLKILKVFMRRIGLLFVFVVALYFDGTHFASIYPHAQLVTNAFMIIAFFILYYRSNKRTRELMIYAVFIGLGGEYLFSRGLDMYTYRLENLPWYIPFGHGAVYARTYMFSKASITRKYAKQINTLLYIIISIFALIYLIAFNDHIRVFLTRLQLNRPNQFIILIFCYLFIDKIRIISYFVVDAIEYLFMYL